MMMRVAPCSKSQEYVESIIASGEMRKREVIQLDEDAQDQLDMFLSGGGK